MRKLLFALCFLQFGLSAQDNDPILFSIGEDNVHLSEFKYIYEKNNSDKADYSEQSIKEYLELYKKFKLKVHRARLLGLDTIKTLQKELEGYRKQLAATYLKDKEIAERLVNEVVDRYTEDREVSHIFVAAGPKTTISQGEMAKEKIDNIYRKLVKNEGSGFDLMAKTLSEDKATAKKAGLLGFYTAPLPDGFYEFENAMYNTPVGEFSEPFRTKMGYHILKVSQVRPARGEMEIAHILIRKTTKGKTVPGAELKMDSVYNYLKEGRTFESLAAKFSQDNKTKDKGGYLGFFGVNQYERPFEDAAFGLMKDNSYTKPIETKIGYHIIKRISKRDNKDKKRARKRIESRINNNDRFKIAERKLIQDVKIQADFKEDRSQLVKLFAGLDDSFYSYKWEPQQYPVTKTALFSLAGKDYNLNDFCTYLKSNVRERLKFSKSKELAEAGGEMYEKYVVDRVMAHEEANLEKKYPDFKALMREYREGILLFEITKNEVWDKASQDTVGLEKFYAEHSDDYKWEQRTKAQKINVEAVTSSKLQEVMKYAEKKGSKKFLDKYKKDGDMTIEIEEEVVDTDSPLGKIIPNKKGKVSKPELTGNKGHFYTYLASIAPSQKTLKEARGYVIADYQDHLEAVWIKSLKEAHKIDLDEKVLKSIVR